jgi:hypothetical protein
MELFLSASACERRKRYTLPNHVSYDSINEFNPVSEGLFVSKEHTRYMILASAFLRRRPIAYLTRRPQSTWSCATTKDDHIYDSA